MATPEHRLPSELQAAGQALRTLFGNRLMAAREAAGLSQTALAERAGMDAGRVAAIEAGTVPTMVLSEMVELALHVGQDVSELVKE